jgi:hemerythrin-like domain-containing protein
MIEEKNKIKAIMDNFRIIHSELSIYENLLTSIEKGDAEKNPELIKETGSKIRSCIERLKEEREKEKILFSEMESKYGPGELDMNTLEYKTKL